MGKKLMGALMALTFLTFLFPALVRITVYPMALIIAVMTIIGFGQIGKVLLFTFKPSKEKPDGNQTGP